MLKAVAGAPGNQCLIVGFSFGNIDRFVCQPRDTHIRIRAEETGLPVDVIFFSGERLTALMDEKGTKKKIFMIGLCMEELAILRNKPLRAITKIDGKNLGVAVDIMIFSGATEMEMAEHFADVVGPNTKYTVSPRLVN